VAHPRDFIVEEIVVLQETVLYVYGNISTLSELLPQRPPRVVQESGRSDVFSSSWRRYP